MTKSQAQRIRAKLNRIDALAGEVAAIFGDDPMVSDGLFTAVNNIAAAASWGLEALDQIEVK
jgi:hypothetical protein